MALIALTVIKICTGDHRFVNDEGAKPHRGRSFLKVTIAMRVTAADVGQALVIAWRVFRKATGDDLGAGWDTASASAEVSPVAASGGEVPGLEQQRNGQWR